MQSTFIFYTNTSFYDLFFLGNVYFRLEEYKKSQVIYLGAIAKGPRDPELLDNLKLTQEKLGNGQPLPLPKTSAAERFNLFMLLVFIIFIFSRRKLKAKKMRLGLFLSIFSLYFFIESQILDLNYGSIAINYESLDLMSGRDKGSISLFKSEKGTLFKILEKSGRHLLVEDFKKNRGWVLSESVFVKPSI